MLHDYNCYYNVAYYLNGITVSDNGDIRTCPAANPTRGCFGNVRNESLRQLYDKVQNSIIEVMGRDLPACLVRDTDYRRLISIFHQ